MLLGDVKSNERMAASIEREFRNYLAPFATDLCIAHAFRGERESAETFDWTVLEDALVFFQIPAEKIEAWSPAIRLMVVQMIRSLERRPEQYSELGKGQNCVLFLLDEFARIGKLPMITDAVATLRSKGVKFLFTVQSIAQLDSIYGKFERKVLVDNCDFKVLLRVNDAETQRYFADMIGTCLHKRRVMTRQMNEDFETTGYTYQVGETRDSVIQPNELAKMKDIILLSPFGVYRVLKVAPNDNLYSLHMWILNERNAAGIIRPAHFGTPALDVCCNEHAQILTISERLNNANVRIETFMEQQREERKKKLLHQEIEKMLNDIYPHHEAESDLNHRCIAFMENLINDKAAKKWLVDHMTQKNSSPGQLVPLN